MNRFFVTFEASAAYTTNAPTVQVLVNGMVISSGLITAQTGFGTTLLSFELEYAFGSNNPASLSFRFSDGFGEPRTVTVNRVTVNGQGVDTTYISMMSLTQGQSAAITVAPIDHFFGRVEPVLADFGTPDIVGTASDDDLRGGAARDVISALGGNDRVVAGAGDNVVSGGAGNDTLIGGAGNDLLTGEADNDYIIGAGGNDLLHGGAGTDVLLGGAGNDVLNGGADNDTLMGDGGDDVLYGEGGDDKLLGHAGNDYLYGDAGIDWMDGGAGNDTMYGGTENDLMAGGAGNDTMYGEDGDDDIDGGANDDTIDGGAGIDRISGGTGNDTLSGGDGNDLIMGDAGGDTLNGGNNDDSLLGGVGADTLNGGAGNDRLYGHSPTLVEASQAVLSIANLTYNMSSNSYYRHIAGATTYAAAKAAAEAATIVIGGITYYGHLVTINSAAENVFVDTLIGGSITWIGATDATNEGQWVWQGGPENGLQFSLNAASSNNFYVNWAGGEPNNGGNSDGAVLEVDGLWYDRPLTDNYGYVIEWDAINIGDDGAIDTINGDAGNDILHGGAGNDILSGGGDADQVFGGAGNDTLNGNDGDDFLQDHAGTNTFNGGNGSDILDSRYHGTGTPPAIGVQTMYGGAGNDYLYGNTGNDLLYGEANDDFINGFEGNDTIDGGAGTDTIYGNVGSDTLSGGDGNDVIYAVIPRVTLLSTNFNATTEGFAYADNTFGGTGGAYVNGSRNTGDGVNGNGSLEVFFDGTNGTASGLMSGAHSLTFNAANTVDNVLLTFQFRVIREGTYETNEDSMVYVEIDGTRYGLNGNDYILRLESDGNDPQFDTGWRQVEINLGTITAGNHTIALGGAVEGKDNANEDTTIRFDNVVIASEVATDDTFANNINGGNNDDTIYGSAGTDTLSGGAGNDTIYSASTLNVSIANVLANYAGVVHNATTGSFYLFVNSVVTWQAAQNAAVAYQIYGVAGHLAHSNSLTENQYLDTISGTNNIWLGGSDGEVNGEWRWVGGPNDGTQFWQGAIGGTPVGGAYSNWNPGEPNDYNGWESRLEMYNGGVWNDQLEGSTARYVIEWEDSQILVAGNTSTLNGGTGVDNLYGADGSDIFQFDNMADVDVIYNFDRTDGDAIDVEDILVGYDPVSDAISDFVIISDGTAADSFEATIVNYDPLLYYRLNDQAGTTMTDHMGVRNGTYVNTPTLAQNNDFNGGLANDSVDFKGGGNAEFGRVTDNAIFDMTAGTFMAWFRSDSTSATDQIVFAKEGTGNPGRFHLGVDTQSGNVVGTFRINGNTYNVDQDPAGVLGDDININTWYHLAFTFGTGGVSIYVNGQSVWTGAANFTSIGSNYDFIVGGNNEGGNANGDIDEFFNGLLDEVVVLNSRLSQQSIQNIYNAGLNAVNGTFADGVYVNDDGAGGVYTRIADFSGTTNVYNNAVDMLAGNNLIA